MDAAHIKQSLMTLADILRCPADIMGWRYGYDLVPVAVGKWIEWLAAAHDSNSPPTGGPAPEPLDQE